MTPDELTFLCNSALNSDGEADDCLDRLRKLYPQCAGRPDQNLYCPELQITLGRPSMSTSSEELWHDFAQVFKLSGAIPYLYDHDISGGSVSAELRKVWHDAPGKASTEPDVQALACLRQLEAPNLEVVLPGARLIVQRRLSALLVRYPALLHPRMGYLSHQAGASDTRSMLTSILFSDAALPCTLDGIVTQELIGFALHPCLRQALAKPHIDRSKSMAALLGDTPYPNPRLAVSLLQLERLHRTVMSGQTLLARAVDEPAALGMYMGLSLLGGCVRPTSAQAAAAPGDVDVLAEEMRQSSLTADSMLAGTLSNLVQLYYSDVSGVTAARQAAKLFEVMTASGMCESAQAAANSIAERLFGPGAHRLVYAALHHDDHTGGAQALLGKLEDAGVSFERMAKLIDGNLTDESPYWQYATAESRRRAMASVVEAGEEQRATAAASPSRSARRGAL